MSTRLIKNWQHIRSVIDELQSEDRLVRAALSLRGDWGMIPAVEVMSIKCIYKKNTSFRFSTVHTIRLSLDDPLLFKHTQSLYDGLGDWEVYSLTTDQLDYISDIFNMDMI